MPADPARGPRRELGAVVALLLAGGGLALVVSQAVWVHVRVDGVVDGVSVDVGVRLDLDVSGTQAAPAVLPLAVLAMAGAFGLLATRGWARRVLAGLLVLAGLGTVLAALHVLTAPKQAAGGSLTGQSVDPVTAAEATYQLVWWWPALTVLAGCVVLAGAVAGMLRGGRWPAMGARFDAPATAAQVAAAAARPGADPWAALDRGEDPTAVESSTDLPESGLEPGTTDGGGRLR